MPVEMKEETYGNGSQAPTLKVFLMMIEPSTLCLVGVFLQ